MKSKIHLHKFLHTGGGMMMVGEGFLCDDSYSCKCGERIIIKSNYSAQLQLPKIIRGQINDEEIDNKYEEAVDKNRPN